MSSSGRFANFDARGGCIHRFTPNHRMELLVFTSLALAGSIAHVGGVGFGFGWIFFILIPLFWIAVFALLFSLGRRRMRRHWAAGGYGRGPWGGAARSAEASLAERFAQGEIDSDEYRARLDVLRSSYPTPPAK